MPALLLLGLIAVPGIAHGQVTGILNRWTSTSAGPSASRGDPVTLRWSIVADGTPIPGDGGANSNLVTSLGGSVPSDVTSWFDYATTTFSSVSGVTFQYITTDDGVAISGANPGINGVRADVRIGGHNVDGPVTFNPGPPPSLTGGVLAYNSFPSVGDMVVDTTDLNTGANMNGNFGFFAQTIMHELGHGLGLTHVDSTGHTSFSVPQLMEPFTSSAPAQPMPQFNDILALQRNYGDVYEKGLGNDILANATNLGVLVDGSPLAIGTDAPTGTALVEVLAGDIDFVSIDGFSDTDVYQFTMTGSGLLDATLDPRGSTYTIGDADLANPTYVSFDAASQLDLTLEILDSSGNVLATANAGALNFSETVSGLFLFSGTYFARITGTGPTDSAQMYTLSLSTVTAVPEPSTFVLAGLGVVLGGGWIRRRRQRRAVG